jgi:hypothetical protein
MENQNQKIANIKLEISDNCSSENKNIISLYWELNSNFELKNTPGSIKQEFNITQGELSKITSSPNCLSFFIHCKKCNSFESQKTYSQSQFKNIFSLLKRIHFKFECNNCTTITNKERHRQQIKDEKERQQRQEEEHLEFVKNMHAAIESKAWENVSNFERAVLRNCIEFNNFQKLKKHYWQKLGEQHFGKLFAALRNLRTENLLILIFELWDNSRITDYHVLESLIDQFEEINDKEIARESEVFIDNETNEIKFKLTINENQQHPDQPMYAGTVTFNERIVIEPGVEYIFGQWQRANNNLYLTMMPIDNLEKTPTQKRVSKLPISVKKGVKDFLNNMGKNNNF